MPEKTAPVIKLKRMNASQSAAYFDAINSGRIDEVKAWCKSGLDFREARTERNRDGKMVAAITGQKDILSAIMDAEIKLAEREMLEHGWAFSRARGALNNRDNDMMSVTLHAAANNQVEIFDMMIIKYKDNLGGRQFEARNELMLAAIGGHVEMVDAIARHLGDNPVLRYDYLTMTDASTLDAESACKDRREKRGGREAERAQGGCAVKDAA